jgi:predicted PhzF superfamily epimerase YddE/YHI9
MQLSFTTLDVFTKIRYIGNPLAVVRVPASLRNQLTEEQKQRITREFNLSEATFLHEPSQGQNTVEFDIFTPLSRISFAGHPTVGTAVYVAQHAATYPGITQLRTVAGTIPFAYEPESGRSTVSVPHDFYTHCKRLAHPFPNASTNNTGSSTVPLVSIVKGMAFNLIQLADLDALALPTHGLLPASEVYKFEHLDAGSGWDIGYTGSYFYVDLGDDTQDHGLRLLRTRSMSTREDPGTGSASTALCCYIAVTESKEGIFGERKFHLTQGVEMGRRCDIFVTVRVSENGKIEDVKLGGTAVEIMEGVLTVE